MITYLIQNGRTLVPVRAITEAMGAVVNGKKVNLDEPPLRFIMENTGDDVKWDPDHRRYNLSNQLYFSFFCRL